MATDFYELLGVARDASEDEIKRAYRKLARELHPDANGGDPQSEARFKEVSIAYETLRDPERRRRYDTFGPDQMRGSGPGPGPGPGDMFGGGLGDLFDAFFGGGAATGFGTARPAGPRRGDDVEVVLDLKFEEAVFGVERSVSWRGPVTCTTCSGSGARPGTSPTTCPECQGLGQVRRVRQSILGQVVTTAPCPRCRGYGEVVASPCADCRGEGRRTDDRSVTVEVPPGVDEGTTLRISGSGSPAPRGGLPGDLYVHLRVAGHDRFERSGADLVTRLHVAFTQAALGADVTIETLDGSESITLAPGTQTGKTVRLRGHGVPHVRGRGRGDLHVEVVVDTPTGLDKEQDRLLRELARMRGEEVSSGEGGLFSRIRSSLG
ncbi:MAG TPA: molecular chaperone DnaJ [Acidimicrobiales bacterium]|nr:molecular chaperone DnaJ [Acidimicrobiales bacterium]